MGDDYMQLLQRKQQLDQVVADLRDENKGLREATANCNCKTLGNNARTRFFNLIEKTEECWNWLGSKVHGYGKMSVQGRPKAAHRFSYELHKGEIPIHYHVDHLCNNRGCVNPEHLKAVPPRENILRANGVTAKNLAKTHCPHGHPYDSENTRIVKLNGQRRCRTCEQEYRERRRPKQRAYERAKRKQIKEAKALAGEVSGE